jgi:hypothetical protein
MFENLSIGIKTFLRDEQLFNTLHAIRTNLPGAQMIIADCGDMTEEKDSYYAGLERDGHIHIDLPFDSGFGVMSNSIVERTKRKFLLIGADDFDFAPTEVRQGIKRLERVLEEYPPVSIASGRVNNSPYEFHLIERQPGEWYERPLSAEEYWQSPFVYCDLTVNYSLIRMDHLNAAGIRWDVPEPKIGGAEHAAFFLDCKKSGLKTVYVSGVGINEQKIRNSPRYNLYRRRAQDPQRPCFIKRKIKKYVLGDGRIDYEET